MYPRLLMLVFCGLMLSRLLPFYTVFSPFLALVVLTGTLVNTRMATALVAVAVVGGDLLLGWHNTLPFTWLAMAGLFATGVYARPTSELFLPTALSGVVVFFAVTNAAVWWGSVFYPQNMTGLLMAYVAGLPFLGGQLMGCVGVAALYAAWNYRAKPVYTLA